MIGAPHRPRNHPHPWDPHIVVDEECCRNGWVSLRDCNYTGGCFCSRKSGHKGRCRCDCGSSHSAPIAAADLTETDP